MATQKIHFFTGKGGVGKSLLAASYAYARAVSIGQTNTTEHSGPVLLAELTERSFYKDFLELDHIGYKPTPIDKLAKNLLVSQWNTTECLKEYAMHLLKIESLYKLFFETPVSKSLISVAPGLQELAILGKATSDARKYGPKMGFSQIVIDAFASGHFMSLLRAPKAMSEIISFGPMGQHSRGIDLCLRDPNICEVHLVTLPEELPTTETIELYQQLKNEFGITPRVYLNKLLNLTAEDFNDLKPDEKKYFSELNENEKISAEKLTVAEIKFQKIAFIPEINTQSLIRKISKELIADLKTDL